MRCWYVRMILTIAFSLNVLCYFKINPNMMVQCKLDEDYICISLETEVYLT